MLWYWWHWLIVSAIPLCVMLFSLCQLHLFTIEKFFDMANFLMWSRVAQLVELSACTTRVVGLIPTGEQYENVCTHSWIRGSTKCNASILMIVSIYFKNTHQKWPTLPHKSDLFAYDPGKTTSMICWVYFISGWDRAVRSGCVDKFRGEGKSGGPGIIVTSPWWCNQ